MKEIRKKRKRRRGKGRKKKRKLKCKKIQKKNIQDNVVSRQIGRGERGSGKVEGVWGSVWLYNRENIQA